jgi:hypothetical protein
LQVPLSAMGVCDTPKETRELVNGLAAQPHLQYDAILKSTWEANIAKVKEEGVDTGAGAGVLTSVIGDNLNWGNRGTEGEGPCVLVQRDF